MVANAIDPKLFTNSNIKTLATNNPGKLAGLIVQYNEHRANGGTCGMESFVMSCLADEGGIDPITGQLPAAHEIPGEPAAQLKTKFKSAACQNLAERDFDRCVSLLNEYNDQCQKPGTLASKLDQESYLELHADLAEGELPWPGAVQEALRKAGK